MTSIEVLFWGRSFEQCNPLRGYLAALGKIAFYPDPQAHFKVSALGGLAVLILKLGLVIVAHVENDVVLSVNGELVVVQSIDGSLQSEIHFGSRAQNCGRLPVRA